MLSNFPVSHHPEAGRSPWLAKAEWRPFQVGHVYSDSASSFPSPHSLFHMPAAHLHGNARAGLDLEKWGSWSFCHNGREESRGPNEALFIQRGGWRTTPKAHRTPRLCDGELSGSCWGDSVWCQRGWLLPTCGGGHPSCSRRPQLCLFHSAS